MRTFAKMSNVARVAIAANAVVVVAVVGIALLSPSSSPAAMAQQPGRQKVTENGVRFSFKVPSGWERFTIASGKNPRGPISLNRSIVGPQGAEVIIYWTSFPDGDYADPCARVLNRPIGRSATALAAAVATAPGTELVKRPSDVTLGGHPAKYVALKVRKNVGCDPGFFYSWDNYPQGGAFWHMHAGDAMQVWLVDVDGTRLFIAAAVAKGWLTASLKKEIRQIVESLRIG